MTIHVPERPIDPAEASALDLVRELAVRPDIEAVDICAGALPWLQVSVSPDGVCSAAVVKLEARRQLGHSQRQEWDQEIRRLGQSSFVDAVLPDLLVVTAHRVLRADLLITNAPFLLNIRDDRFYKAKNICTPSEGCKVLGLYMRSQHAYEVSARGVVLDVGRYGFYEILSKELLPQLQVYSRACFKMSVFHPLPALGLDRLAETLWKRAKWSLEARDAIGIQFHQPQTG